MKSICPHRPPLFKRDIFKTIDKTPPTANKLNYDSFWNEFLILISNQNCAPLNTIRIACPKIGSSQIDDLVEAYCE